MGSTKEYRTKNAEHIRAYNKMYRERNPSRFKATLGQFKATPEKRSWDAMRVRCLNPNHISYGRYGGRGIGICERWASFENFMTDMGSRPEGTSLERVDNNKGYSPENCKWATRKEQQNNTVSNIYVSINGETKTLTQWAELMGRNFATIRARIARGWNPEKAILTPNKWNRRV